MESEIADFIKKRRKQLELTQPELAERAGVGLRFIRELEQGKQTVRLDKVKWRTYEKSKRILQR
jgi:y4mF family transcriptional regulator